jgi:type IV secretory pathway TrbD component
MTPMSCHDRLIAYCMGASTAMVILAVSDWDRHYAFALVVWALTAVLIITAER